MRISKLSLALSILLIVGLSFIPSVSIAEDSGVSQTWVRMRGQITQWGSTPVFGWVNVHARAVDTNNVSKDWAWIRAIWSDSGRHLNCTDLTTENITYSFFAACLTNSSLIEFDYSGYDFYIQGSWNVYNVTFEYYVNEYGDLLSYTLSIEAIATDADGELRVSNDWTDFEVNIDELDLLSGNVIMHAVGQMEINICDINGDHNVGIADLARTAKSYGAMPGLGNYNHEMDFNLDYKIDIGDLTTVAANIKA